MDILLMLLLMLPGFILSLILTVVYERKLRKSQNKVHFYVARDKNTLLYLYLGKPERAYYAFRSCENGYCFVNAPVFRKFGLNPDDFKDLKWEDEPVEIFLNMEN